EDRGAGDAVNIVVAVDADTLTLLDRLIDALGSFSSAGQRPRRVQVIQRSVEEGPSPLRSAQATVEQYLGDHRRHVEGASQRRNGGRIVRQQVPLLGHRRQSIDCEWQTVTGERRPYPSSFLWHAKPADRPR